MSVWIRFWFGSLMADYRLDKKCNVYIFYNTKNYNTTVHYKMSSLFYMRACVRASERAMRVRIHMDAGALARVCNENKSG